MMLNRVLHDEWLVDLASSKGAKYLTGARVESVNGETVTLRDGRNFHGKIIVGAGGHNDPLRRTMWSESSLKIPIKFVLMEGEFGDAVELHFGSMAPGDMHGFFPRKEGQILDLESRTSSQRAEASNSLAEGFISNYEGDITFRGAGSLPMSGSIKQFVKGNHLLVGDSAGMVLPSNGAGITIAMVGGRIAGQTVVSHLDEYVSA